MQRNEEMDLAEKVIAINRVTKTNKGGKTISFNALVTMGDSKGSVGIGLGKAHEVAEAIKKAIKSARKNIIKVPLRETSIPHEVIGHFGASRIMLKPASEGTGVIAGGVVRAICEMAGIRDILTKSLGSPTPVNLARATITAFSQLRLRREEEKPEIEEVKNAAA